MKRLPSVKEHDLFDSPIKLLCDLLNPYHTPEQNQAVLVTLTDSDWSALLHLAEVQGVASILSSTLQASALQHLIPDRIQSKLQQITYNLAARNVRMLHEAGIILSALTQQGLHVIALKGLYLIEAVYADISLRQFADLDLMVKRDDVDSAIACLCELGYSVNSYFSSSDVNQDIKHVPPMSKPNGPFVELHWTILEEDEPFDIDVDGMWQRAIPATIAGVSVLAMGIEDLILHLCLHLGYQHHLHLGLRGLYDIVAVLERHAGQVNWQYLVQVAQQWGADRVTCLVLDLAKRMLGADVPEMFFDQLTDCMISEALFNEASYQLLEGRENRAGMTPDIARLGQTHSLSGKINILAQRVFIPRLSLARLYDISPRSIFIFWYYIQRLFDLLRQYGQNSKKIFNPDIDFQQKLDSEHGVGKMRAWMSRKADYE